MEDDPSYPRPFVARVLPWIIAAAALVLYLATLNRWVAVTSLGMVSQIAGWDGQVPVSHPLLYLVTRPIAGLPGSSVPYAANVLTAIFAAASLGLLARCVAILPQDRTRAQRLRGHVDGSPLDSPLAWAPPLLASLLLGFQLTFWEQATAASGESLSLLVFAGAAWCLLEFRRTRRDGWLIAFAATLGAGMATNWAMIGFAPLFAVALAWIVGWDLLNVRRLGLLAAALGAGLLLYLLMPLVARGTSGLPDSFGGSLVAILGAQKNQLLGMPAKSRLLMLAPIMLLPLVAVGLKVGSSRGSGLERMATGVFLVLLQLLWVGGAVFLAFDQAFSPRQLVTLAPEFGGMPLLTWSFLAALSVGYFSGYFILLGTVAPSRDWDRGSGGLQAGQKLLAWVMVAGVVALPAALLWKNLPLIRHQNGSLLDETVRQLTAGLPAEPCLIMTEDLVAHALVQAHLRRREGADHLLVNTRLAPQADYRRHLAATYGQSWPELATLAAADSNVGGTFLMLVTRAAAARRSFYINPAVNFITELHALRPHGALLRLEPYSKGVITPPPLTREELSEQKAYWEAAAPFLARIREARIAGAPVGEVLAALWSRHANTTGVYFQRAGELPGAASFFQAALDLFPENAAAGVNLSVNKALRDGHPLTPDLAKPIATYPLGMLLEAFGPVDEPGVLRALGDGTLKLAEPLARAAAIAYQRLLELDPKNLPATVGFAEAYLAAAEPVMALKAVQEGRQLAKEAGAEAEFMSRLTRVEALARFATGDRGEVEQMLVTAVQQNPTDRRLLDLLVDLYVDTGRPAEALPPLEARLKAQPDDESLLEKLGFVQLKAGLHDAAAASLGKVLRRRPDNIPARLNRATAHLQAGKLKEAREDYEYMLRKNPDSGQPRLGLAEVAEREGKTAEAVRQLERTLETVPPGSDLHQLLSEKLARLRGNAQ